MQGRGEEKKYALPPHLSMLADAVIDIAALTKEITELNNQIQLMRADLDQMARSMDDFQRQAGQVKTKAIEEMLKIIGDALDDRLEQVEKSFARMGKEIRKGGRRSHPLRHTTSRPGWFSRLFRRRGK